MQDNAELDVGDHGRLYGKSGLCDESCEMSGISNGDCGRAQGQEEAEPAEGTKGLVCPGRGGRGGQWLKWQHGAELGGQDGE